MAKSEIQIRIPSDLKLSAETIAKLRKAFRTELAQVRKRSQDDPPINDMNITIPNRPRPSKKKKAAKKV